MHKSAFGQAGTKSEAKQECFSKESNGPSTTMRVPDSILGVDQEYNHQRPDQHIREGKDLQTLLDP